MLGLPSAEGARPQHECVEKRRRPRIWRGLLVRHRDDRHIQANPYVTVFPIHLKKSVLRGYLCNRGMSCRTYVLVCVVHLRERQS